MPDAQFPRKFERAITTKARFVVLIGGRGSAKSESVGRLMLMKCQTEAADILCCREVQKSIEESVHKLLCKTIEKLDVPGFSFDKTNLDCLTGGKFAYKGMAHMIKSVKSYYGNKYCWVEEAQDMSAASIKDLLPTIREAGAQLFFTANPQSSADPFSQRFIVPYLKELHKNGFYEDDLHLIIMMNWRDNPWHKELEAERAWDKANKPAALYEHIWEGAFNDSVDNALIQSEWFDACIDAHKVLGIKPLGIRFSAHDPSDIGPDPKGFAFRHGSVVLDVQQKDDGDINEGGDWATGLAINHVSDAFTWDCDGMGVGLSRQISEAFQGKPTKVAMFKGSEKPVHPKAIFQPADDIIQQKTNEETFLNRRAQSYFELRNLVLNTYNAVVNKVYTDPEELISFDSGIKLMTALRSELCRMPIKLNKNGKLALYTKEELKKAPFNLPSPNLSDSIMMLTIPPPIRQPEVKLPPIIRPMGDVGRRPPRSGMRM